ncbi:MAG: acetylxylan esterase [Cyclobacteriaceae bacterium]
MKSILIILTLFIGCLNLRAQTSDTNFSRPLVEVLDELQAKYSVRIKFNKEELEDFDLKYANWRLVAGDLESSLTKVLAPFDFIFVKQDEGVYKVKPFQYHLITPEAGAASLEYLKTLYADQESWKLRKAALKQCMIEVFGISELPKAQNPQVILTNKRTYKGYSVENIALETVPGLYVTGSIYSPNKAKGKQAVIISPNGHFGDGRYREDQQLRCAALAKMGAIAVSYDLFGWGESLLQVDSKSHRKSIAHTIQTNNAISLLDYLLKDKKADAKRVGITGGSGGGSQTMLVSAIDDRITVSAPVVMTSSFHAGGCPCESGTPIHLCGERTNNAEIAAMMAPKPQLIISDGGDWTFQVPEVEYPFIQRTYSFYNAANKVSNVHLPDEKHDYGYSKRIAMYEFMAANLSLNLEALTNKSGKIDESSITNEDYEELYAFGKSGEKFPEDAIKSLAELYEVIEKNK